jgi:hypothetical protein
VTAEDIRAVIGRADPKLLEFGDLLRAKFDARLVWLKTPEMEMGSRRYLKTPQ